LASDSAEDEEGEWVILDSGSDVTCCQIDFWLMQVVIEIMLYVIFKVVL